MYPPQRSDTRLRRTVFGIGVIGLMTVLAVTAIAWQRFKHNTQGAFSPETMAVASKNDIGRVGMWIDDSVHYQMDGAGPEEFRHLVRPVDEQGEFSPVAMLHQLQCLQVIQEEYAAHNLTVKSQHCMEYLRHSILCLADTRLESVRFSKPPHVVALPGEYECRDWTAIIVQ